ncbi:MAG: SDR family NAD(P)-dependent oxidoreductase [Gammaproteobacteria bacterium]|jgi:NAD(P)-dependent dehydrogenase (short-subunit alcohol dehydrogenase family)|nr:SDR family NAD(P)-dependent oxidoreductase [Gammaproteobacteria bacterium]MBP6052550.1 SDR family NAD(P)-dependent oxidoreductase [Pseudomonadales bacterium]MBK6582056.1 SDR family NAD(P)-dependent oxidoreductase [Gammaproteobacteria bacterium]MBK7521671.1 SDR family NAD(P)-dependent oxidoreductase [Gammaproteobacteria bacterium]MBK7729445.1 SDR family NAD(P)-dependent oxidoreductase [Gammaproteobacteria bacterium]
MSRGPDSRRSVFITGAGGGLGGATARYLAARNWQVFAADFAEAALRELGGEENITTLVLDVTAQASVDAAVAQVARSCEGLDGIVNFAGILEVGSVIEVDPETIRHVLDVNVMGTVRVNHALFPLLLARKGRIVNISSETGWQSAMPFNGIYAMSKHAIEAYSDALRRELMFLGVPVIKIQPGPFRTAMVSSIERNFARAAQASKYFGDLLGNIGQATIKEQAKAHPPEVLAQVVHTALSATCPRIAYSVKPDPQRVVLNRLPQRALDALLRLALKPR